MNVNTNTEVTLYDFLNYEVIGVLLLFICGFTPCDTIYEWVFFIFAFIAGLAFSKLAENAFWTKWTRNPRWAVCLGIEILNKKLDIEHTVPFSDYSMNAYYADYYRISKEPIYKTIQILEAQYKFIGNMFLLLVICLCISVFVSDDLSNFLCVEVYRKQGKMLMIVYFIMFFFACVGCVIKEEPRSDSNNYCRKVDLKCANVLLLTISFFLGLIVLMLPNSLFCVSLFTMMMLAFLACKVQLKISTLVIEGAYYSKLGLNNKIRYDDIKKEKT